MGGAESLPFPDDHFDAVLAQLVVLFMSDPVAGLVEMRRVARPGALVGANVWDHGSSGRGPLSSFWRAVGDLDPDAADESHLVGVHEGELARLFTEAGYRDIQSTLLTVRVEHPTFDDWWEPYTLGVGPAGSYVAALDPERREELRAHCAKTLPDAPFSIDASAWTVLARA
jgi:SAM-dependent methyltransferase